MTQTTSTNRGIARQLRQAQESVEQAAAKTEQALAERDRLIVEMVESGYEQVAVARLIGVTKARVNHIMKAHREAMKAQRSKEAPAPRATAGGVTTRGVAPHAADES